MGEIAIDGVTAKKTDRILYIDALRVFGSIAVMIIHIASGGWESTGSFREWDILNVIESFSRWCVPVFIMISGSLFIGRYLSFKTIFRKYFLHMVVAFLFWSFVYAIDGTVRNPQYTIKDTMREFVYGHYHLWFLATIAKLYLIVPFINEIVKNEKLTKAFLAFGTLVSMGFSHLAKVMALLFPSYSKAFYNIQSNSSLFIVGAFPAVFILGYYINKKRLPFNIVCVGGIIGFTYTVFMSRFVFKYTGVRNQIFYEYLTLNVMLESVFVFELFKKLFNEKRHFFKTKYGRIIANLCHEIAPYSFGAYLVHVLFVEELEHIFGLNALSHGNPFAAVGISLVIVFVLSYSASIILHQIPLVGKYIT